MARRRKNTALAPLALRPGAFVLALTATLGGHTANADEGLTPPSPWAMACEIQGSTTLGKGVALFENVEGSQVRATFAGVPANLTVLGFPASGTVGRTKVRTGSGVRIEGFLEASELPLYAAVNLPVVPGHLWIAQGQRVRFSGAKAVATVEGVPAGAFEGQGQNHFRVDAPCSWLALEPHAAPAWDVPGSGRGYLPRAGQVALHSEPGGSVTETVRMTHPASVLFWSTESRDGFVHVLLHRELVIDAWVSASELTPLKAGETMDQAAPPTVETSGARLLVSGKPEIVRVTHDVPLRLSTSDAAKPVGIVERGSEVYVMETMLGWCSVLPRALHVLPPKERSFWVPASEMGAAPPAKAARQEDAGTGPKPLEH